jgi:hypothetical protein
MTVRRLDGGWLRRLAPAACVAAGLAAATCATADGAVLAQARSRQVTPCGPPPLAPCKPSGKKQKRDSEEKSRAPSAASPDSAPRPDDNVPHRTTPCGPGGGLGPCTPPQ